jgi:hypothetical protein
MLIVWPFDAEGFITGEETYRNIRGTAEVPRLHRRALKARVKAASMSRKSVAVSRVELGRL